jgi:hypothetical protein
MGVGAVFAGIAIGTGVGALDARDAFSKSGNTDVAAHDRAADLRTWANVAWIAAGVTTVTGVVLVIAGGSGDKKKAASLAVSPAGVSISGHF